MEVPGSAGSGNGGYYGGGVRPFARGVHKRMGKSDHSVGGRGDVVCLREMHVYCGAVRVSVVDGDLGEMVLGSLERMSMSVAATATEVDLKFKLGSFQIDSHMPG